MAERNIHDSWFEKGKTEYRELLRKAKEANAVPIGEERLTTAEARNRFVNMSKPERRKFIAEKGGTEAVLKLLRGE